MKRSLLYLWLTLTLIYAVFYLWHTPLRGPLTSHEIESNLAKMEMGDGVNGTITPELVRFFETDDGQSFYMFILNNFSEEANYPDGLYPEIKTGAEAAALYNQFVAAALIRRGSYPFFATQKIESIVNTLDEDAEFFEAATIVRYRSRRDFLELVTSDGFIEAEVHKWASLENTVVSPSSRLFLLDMSGVLQLILLVIGSMGTIVIALRSERKLSDLAKV
ncbi:MAG: hypothetical protein AAF902_02200 [Chloroflexota bacterium]